MAIQIAEDRAVKTDNMTTLFWKNTEEISARIEPIKVLGAGRAATATLVRVYPEGGEPFECVEKCFAPGLLTRFVYWFFFQSPFPYQHDRNAIGATYYRRSVASKILSSLNGVECPVAESLYTRWDSENQAYVLAAKFVAGRGIVPQEIDPLWIRRTAFNLIIRPLARLVGMRIKRRSAPPEEIKELLVLMHRFERAFRTSGLVGTGWQTSPAALVSPANLLRTDTGYVMVDLESGIPAFLVPYYFFRSVFRFKFPYFDDLEPDRLDRYLDENQERLTESLSEDGFKTLLDEARKLKECTLRWKRGEIALSRNIFSLLFSPANRRAVIAARAESWFREEVIDQGSFEKLSQSGRLFTQLLFLLGAPPGRIGRFLRKVKGNKEYRAKVGQFLSDRKQRREWVQEYVDEHVTEWSEENRLSLSTPPRSLVFGIRFLWYVIVSKITSPRLHRFFLDAAYRKHVITKAGLFLFSNRYQLEYSRYVVHRSLVEWRDHQRISEGEFRKISEQLNTGSIQEYVRVFGMQAALKLFEAITSAIKVAGIGWYLSSFAAHFPTLDPGESISAQLLLAMLQVAAINPISVLMIVNTSVWRTLITLQRMISIKRRRIAYRVALFVGMIPALGTLAYPIQMYAGCRELSVFLMRHIASKVGQNLPIYGGKDTITEIWCIKLINLIVEFLEIIKWLWGHSFGFLFRAVWRGSKKKRVVAEAAVEPKTDSESTRWSRLVDKYVSDLQSKQIV